MLSILGRETESYEVFSAPSVTGCARSCENFSKMELCREGTDCRVGQFGTWASEIGRKIASFIFHISLLTPFVTPFRPTSATPVSSTRTAAIHMYGPLSTVTQHQDTAQCHLYCDSLHALYWTVPLVLSQSTCTVVHSATCTVTVYMNCIATNMYAVCLRKSHAAWKERKLQIQTP